MSIARPASWLVPGAWSARRAFADPGERRQETWVDAAGAEVGALAGGEDDAGVGEQFADRDSFGRRAGGGAGGVAAVSVGQGEDVGDVPVGVVVGEDRALVVLRRTGGAEIVGGRGDQRPRGRRARCGRRGCRRRRTCPRCWAIRRSRTASGPA